MNLKHNYALSKKTVQKQDKEHLLKQRALAIWLTGLPSAGKSTIAIALEKELYTMRYFTQILDGDNIRNSINKDLEFSKEDRIENIRRISEMSKLLINSGVITINSFISPTHNLRNLSKKIIGNDYYEIYVKASLKTCEERDVKGLYAKARNGEIKNFTGIDAPFESPLNPNLTVNTEELSVKETVTLILEHILPIIKQ